MRPSLSIALLRPPPPSSRSTHSLPPSPSPSFNASSLTPQTPKSLLLSSIVTSACSQHKRDGKQRDGKQFVFVFFTLGFSYLEKGKNKDVTDAIQKVAAAYDCKIVEGVLSHQMKQFVIDGNKVVLSVSNSDTRVDDAEFEENEVYAIDIVASTGEGKLKLLDEKQTTIYKRAVDRNYHLKMKASRFIYSEITQKFPIMPFSARALEEKRARLVLVECMNHELLQPYPVLHEKPGDYVAHIKFTVLLMPDGSDRITSHTLQEWQSTKTIDDPEIKAWLALGTKTKKKGGGKKKKCKKAAEGEAEPMEAQMVPLPKSKFIGLFLRPSCCRSAARSKRIHYCIYRTRKNSSE